ncbi:MAG: endonuclease/exonuclease/phosphatase family protein [Opitutae bacterium]|nr:endonuclease/exonuclease/phosphatase family protein [Opitutae bacterium]
MPSSLALFRVRFSALLLALACGGFASQAAPDSAVPIRVGTFNIRYQNNNDGPNGWEHRRDMVLGLIQFHDWEIFGIQEAVAGQIRDLAGMTRYAHVGVGRDDGAEGGEHSPVFYDRARFALLDSGTFWLSDTPEKVSRGWDAACNRVCSWVKLRDQTSGKVFFFFNTHLDHRGKEARKRGIALIMERIAKRDPATAPVILTGDFNASPDSDVIATATAQLRDTKTESQLKPYGPVGTINGFNYQAPLKQCIDYIFASPGTKVLRHGVLSDSRDQRFPSDHLPVMTQLVLP